LAQALLRDKVANMLALKKGTEQCSLSRLGDGTMPPIGAKQMRRVLPQMGRIVPPRSRSSFSQVEEAAVPVVSVVNLTAKTAVDRISLKSQAAYASSGYSGPGGSWGPAQTAWYENASQDEKDSLMEAILMEEEQPLEDPEESFTTSEEEEPVKDHTEEEEAEEEEAEEEEAEEDEAEEEEAEAGVKDEIQEEEEVVPMHPVQPAVPPSRLRMLQHMQIQMQKVIDWYDEIRPGEQKCPQRYAALTELCLAIDDTYTMAYKMREMDEGAVATTDGATTMDVTMD